MVTLPVDLARLAALYGLQTSYVDVNDQVQRAGMDALLAVLQAIGAPVSSVRDVSDALRFRRRELATRRLPPATASFDGSAVAVGLQLAADRVPPRVACHLQLEEGDERSWVEDLRERQPLRVEEVDGRRYQMVVLNVTDVPHGYHRLVVEVGAEPDETLMIVAPSHAYQPRQAARGWGAFLPLYALRTARDWGTGDLRDLEELAGWLGQLGATVVGTLPLLPVYLDGEGFDPSPYRPVSRLFWNELFLDLRRAPELAGCPPAQELLDSADFSARIEKLRAAERVDYRELAELKGRVLAALAQRYFDEPGERRGELERLIAQRPEVEDYALFRGAVARHGPAWWRWPAPARDGALSFELVDVAAARFHLYAQLLAREQVAALSERLRRAGQHPYLDLPIGARADGFDVWRHRQVFAREASAGAPPDAVFTGGQDWNFPPLHPERLQADEYRYLIGVLRHQLELADFLRVDHVMGLHRLWWIPEGATASDGVYVRYRADELYAILCLESHRHRSCIVGENLGTVPTEVEDALKGRAILRMYVVQYEADPESSRVLAEVPADTVASVNTHDMPPFAAFWEGLDIDDVVDLGLFDPEQARRARDGRAKVRAGLSSLLAARGTLAAGRTEAPIAVHAALVEWLGASEARTVLVNLEDLWGEVYPQNTPGTASIRDNWRRRAAFTLDEIRERDDVVRPLRRLDAARRGRQEHG